MSPLPVLNFPFGSYLMTAKMQTFIPTKKTAFSFAVVASLFAALFGHYLQKGKKEEVFSCEEQKYMTEIVSLDPLVIYINDFVSQSEASKLISLGFIFLLFFFQLRN
jgi:prolyl 4-hydroxylase